MFIYELGVAVAAQEHAKIVKPGDYALQLDAIDQEDGQWRLGLADVIEKGVLQVLRFFLGHEFCLFLATGA